MTGRIFLLRLLRAAGGLRSSRLRAAAPCRLQRVEPPSFVFCDYPTDCSLGPRFFSSRPAGSRGHRGGDLKSGGRGAPGGAKSLIEDEAELSDWVSDLRTDSLRLSSNNEDSDDDRPRRVKGGSGYGGNDRFSPRGGRGDFLRKDKPSSWRQRDDDFSRASGRGKSQNYRDSLAKRRFGSDLEEDDDDDDETGFSSRKGRDRGGRKAMPSNFSRGKSQSSRGSLVKRRFDSDDDEDSDEETDFSSGKGRDRGSPNATPSKFSRGKSHSSRGSLAKRQFDSDLEDEDEKKSNFSYRKGPQPGTQKAMSSKFMRGRDGESSFKQTRGGGRSVVLESEGEEDEETEDDDDLSGSDDGLFNDEDGKEASVNDLLRSSVSPQPEQGNNEQLVPKKSESGHESYLSQTRFDECSISSLTLKGVKAAGYERMTLVQEATLPVILKGKDVLAKAKTGTGKTVAFLLPAIEVVSKLPPVDRDVRRPPINILVICPTRELADQAATEANKLVKYHPSIGVQIVMGGTRLALEQKKMQTNPCQILVGTPGRLRDHIENTPGFATRLMGIKVLVLDEADRLLDMGFRKDIEKLVAAIPKQRQTLLFSATVPDEVRQICYIAMKRDLEFINTVEEGTEETHSQVRQMHLVAPLEKQFSMLYSVLTDHISENVDYKVIVFCTTAMVTKLVSDLLSELKLNVREMHSRKPQSYRTRVSKEFKESKGLILVSSDVSARGVDYPNVTLVIQLGVPADRDQYIHRLGRTGRKGKEGTGILILAPWEDFFLSNIKDLPITEASFPTVDLDTRKKVERSMAHVEMKNKESAYLSWLGYYNSIKIIGRDKFRLVSLSNEFSRCMGLDSPPAVPKLALRKMGLNNVPGLRAR